MNDSSDLENLERQASLLQALLGNLERRRDHRRRTVEASPPVAPVESSPEPPTELPPGRVPLRLVEQPQARRPEPGRKPHFRHKRRWDLSGPSSHQQAAVEQYREVPVDQNAAQPPPHHHVAGGRNTAVRVRGCQVELATASDPGGVVYAFAVLTRHSANGLLRRGFHALGGSQREAELACLDAALRSLEEAVPSLPATREVLRIHGRQVEILCDRGNDGIWRAFPFLHEGGERQILLRFHVQEAFTAPSAVEARRLCVHRLQAHFRS